MKIIKLLLVIMVFSSFAGCGITRTETDIYTHTIRDTTTLYQQVNAPGSRDNGVVFPSSRTIKSERNITQYDSIVERLYPDFIRLCAFESVGLMFTGAESHGLSSGLFGLFWDFNRDLQLDSGKSNVLFGGGMYRFLTYEWRLRWFRDAKDWTYGTTGLEVIMPEARLEKTLISFGTMYIRKRFFLREKIPYIAITPSVGLGVFPSQYVNLSGSLDIGSIGGLNLRAYLGFAIGSNPDWATQVVNSTRKQESQSISFPYAGIGISFLDFLNRVEETKTEWKFHEHSAWNVGLLQFAYLSSGAKGSLTSGDSAKKSIFNGLWVRLLNSSVALPLFDYKLYAGTSFINLFGLGYNEFGFGILPIRIGFWQTLILDELTLEPFLEYNYYPSDFVNFGARINLRFSDIANVSFLVGYASGETKEILGNNITSVYGTPISFSRSYIGFSIGIMDQIFFPEHLRYNKK
ncbi:MAG: hypothetical protein HW421_2961 [Ignavibacteria bacterium]|nr:hypothetical protein [Ignavibacteria bacterium]